MPMHRITSVCFIGAVGLCAADCGVSDGTAGRGTTGTGTVANGTAGAAATPTVVTTAGPGMVLAALTLSTGQLVYFGQSASGALVVGELHAVGQEGVLDGDAIHGTPSDIYTTLSNGAQVPKVLVEAVEARRTQTAKGTELALAAARAGTPAPAEPVLSKPPAAPATAGIRPDTLTAAQSSFQSNYCTVPSGLRWTGSTNAYCDLGSGSQNTSQAQWTRSNFMQPAALNDPSSTGNGQMLVYTWNGSSWVPDWSSPTVPPGYIVDEDFSSASLSDLSADFVLPSGGPSGLEQREANPSVTVTWNASTESFQPACTSGFPFDTSLITYVDGLSTNGYGNLDWNHCANIGVQGCCSSRNNDQNPQTITVIGNDTGISADTSVVMPTFYPTTCP